MKAFLIDTNVVLDIVYSQRPRYQNAENFYRGFSNKQLAVEPKVHKECNKVLMDHAWAFSSDLQGYIYSDRKKSKKPWDSLRPAQRKTILNNFMTFVSKQDPNQDGKVPFYKQIIERVGTELSRLSLLDLKDFLVELSQSMWDHLRSEVRARFEYYVPVGDITNEAHYKFISDLKSKLSSNYFNGKQSEDRLILTSVIHLIAFGDINGNEFDTITFYTYDEPFLNVYQSLLANPPLFQEKEYNTYLTKGLKGLTMEKPY